MPVKKPTAPAKGAKKPVKAPATKKAAPKKAPAKKKRPAPSPLGGHPIVWDADALAVSLWEYLDTRMAMGELPIVEEFALSCRHPDTGARIIREYLYEIAGRSPALATALTACREAKEVVAQLGMASGKIPPGFGNFLLKQHGWRDQQEVKVEATMSVIRMPEKKPKGAE